MSSPCWKGVHKCIGDSMRSGLLTSSADHHVHMVELSSWLFTLLIMLGWELTRNYANLMLLVLMGETWLTNWFTSGIFDVRIGREKSNSICYYLSFITHGWWERKKIALREILLFPRGKGIWPQRWQSYNSLP